MSESNFFGGGSSMVDAFNGYADEVANRYVSVISTFTVSLRGAFHGRTNDDYLKMINDFSHKVTICESYANIDSHMEWVDNDNYTVGGWTDEGWCAYIMARIGI